MKQLLTIVFSVNDEKLAYPVITVTSFDAAREELNHMLSKTNGRVVAEIYRGTINDTQETSAVLKIGKIGLLQTGK